MQREKRQRVKWAFFLGNCTKASHSPSIPPSIPIREWILKKFTFTFYFSSLPLLITFAFLAAHVIELFCISPNNNNNLLHHSSRYWCIVRLLRTNTHKFSMFLDQWAMRYCIIYIVVSRIADMMSYATHAAFIKSSAECAIVAVVLLFHGWWWRKKSESKKKFYFLLCKSTYTQASCIIFLYLFSKLKTVLNRDWVFISLCTHILTIAIACRLDEYF